MRLFCKLPNAQATQAALRDLQEAELRPTQIAIMPESTAHASSQRKTAAIATRHSPWLMLSSTLAGAFIGGLLAGMTQAGLKAAWPQLKPILEMGAGGTLALAALAGGGLGALGGVWFSPALSQHGSPETDATTSVEAYAMTIAGSEAEIHRAENLLQRHQPQALKTYAF